MTMLRILSVVAVSCLGAGSALAEGSSDPHNTQGYPAETWTSAFAARSFSQTAPVYGSMLVARPAIPEFAPVTPRANDLESINLAR